LKHSANQAIAPHQQAQSLLMSQDLKLSTPELDVCPDNQPSFMY
jgi:hypothetical protein